MAILTTSISSFADYPVPTPKPYLIASISKEVVKVQRPTIDVLKLHIRECKNVLNLCGKAWSTQASEIEVLEKALTNFTEQYKDMTKALEEERRRANSFWKRPEIIIPLGFILGAGLGLAVSK